MPDNNDPQIYELMIEVRNFTRTTLIHQHVTAQMVGLNVTDAECIDFLQEVGTCTAGDLAKATRLTTGAITNVIDRLEKAGFVKRSPNPADRRKVMVSFIPQKHAPAKAHYQQLANSVFGLLSKYNESELSFLINYTKEMAAVYQAQVEDITSKEG